jgi:DNA-binding SARP family transcriptional activator/TolB-like protein
MSKLNLSLLGQPHIEKDGKPVEINRRKAIALLTYLAVTGEMQGRDKLAGLFWPHEDRESSRAALRRTLTAIRRAVGGEWLVVEGEKVGMNLTGELWLDVKQFDALLDKYREATAQGDPESAENLAPLTEVAKLYRTDFLSQFTLDSNTDFSEWQFFQAENLRRKFAETLARLVEGHARQEEYELAIAYARRRLGLDPLEEECHRSLMRLYAASGHETLALRQYRECEKRLQKELGAEPDPLTRALFDEIKARRPVEPLAPVSKARKPTPSARKDRAPPSRSLWIAAAVAGSVALVAAGALAAVLLSRIEPRQIRIAVLPVEGRDTAGNPDRLLDGLADSLIAELSKVPRLRVKSALSVRSYRDTSTPVSEIGRQLGVAYLVNGSIMRSDGKVRISVHLVDARSDTTVWAEVYERESSDLSAVESEVAEKAAAGITKTLKAAG